MQPRGQSRTTRPKFGASPLCALGPAPAPGTQALRALARPWRRTDPAAGPGRKGGSSPSRVLRPTLCPPRAVPFPDPSPGQVIWLGAAALWSSSFSLALSAPLPPPEAARPPESPGRRAATEPVPRLWNGSTRPELGLCPGRGRHQGETESWARLAGAGRGDCNFAPGRGRGGGARLQTLSSARNLSRPGFFLFVVFF